MIMGGDKKKLAAVIVARIKPQGGFDEVAKKNAEAFEERAKEPENEEEEVSEEMVAIAEEILSAIESKDAKALAKTLSYFDEVNDEMEREHGEEEE